MIELNFIFGVPSATLALLIMWAFRRYAIGPCGNVTQHLGAAIFWVNVKIAGRFIGGDVLESLGQGGVLNWVWNLLGIYVSYHALKALHLLIPKRDRGRYNMFTAAFYPYRMWRKD